MNIKKLIAAIVCVCIISASLFTLAGCGNQKDATTPTESDVETEAKTEEIKDDSKWISEFVDTTVEDGSVVYKTTKKLVDDDSSLAELSIHCFKNDVEQWVYKTQFSASGGDGTNNLVFDDGKVYISINKNYLLSENISCSTIAIDKKTGEEVWCVNNTACFDILLDDENVYVSGLYSGGLYIISKDGEVKAEKLLGDAGGSLSFVDENTISMVNDSEKYDIDISAYKSKNS